MMQSQDVKERLVQIEDELNKRANQLLLNDPVARELLGIKKGLEMSLNGSLEIEEPIDTVEAAAHES
mgnify:CR=1 FL=1|tara:strand:- start:574 stop:774 length:201 start_codon:yes stop_codon:yes gene_type:complete